MSPTLPPHCERLPVLPPSPAEATVERPPVTIVEELKNNTCSSSSLHPVTPFPSPPVQVPSLISNFDSHVLAYRQQAARTPQTSSIPAGEQAPAVTALPEPAETWMRVRQGVIYHKVILENLPTEFAPYNTRQGWAQADELSSTLADSLLNVRLLQADHSETLIKVKRRFVQPVWSTDHLIAAISSSALATSHPELQWVVARIQVAPSQWVQAKLFVDNACQLDGILTSQFVRDHQLRVCDSKFAIRTVTGARATGVASIKLPVRFSPQLSQVLSFGVLDLPVGDGIIGLGFLNRCRPFGITGNSDGSSSLTITIKNQAYSIPGIPQSVDSRLPLPIINMLLDDNNPPSVPPMEGEAHTSHGLFA